MLHALLTRVGGLLHSDRIGHMVHERDSALAGFIGDREVGVARQAVIDLDEVRSVRLVTIDGRARLRHIDDGDTSRPGRFWTIEDGTREVYARRWLVVLCVLRTPSAGVLGPPHLTHADDTVDQIQRIRPRLATRLAARLDSKGVHVHVPEAWDQKLPS